ncbi:folylpolyglutamate synthase [Morchella conica CCBAS932]|uniref:Folylpolyglutamate synthase n=1 Tax=Morchella conica CCBAS932 TaxID=1392247 RepID=A0A3N4KQV0_9PEZI|nr:folylpolyglutamate synthase [Morchella conica CCBAS932]
MATSSSPSTTTTSSPPQRTYSDAVTALNTLQTNFSTLQSARTSTKKQDSQLLAQVVESLRRIGHAPSDLTKLNVIHIAGTKGKGSTCAFISSILSQYRPSPITKIGMYTSPHLRAVRERIQINGAALPEELFARYFFEVWDRMEASARAEGHDPAAKPGYFRFLTLVAFHTYLCEGVDTAILEVGIGGGYDSTNVVERPTVTGITSLGIDHVGVLGGTIEEIAWHKAGILKAGRPMFTAPQTEGALGVIRARVEERGAAGVTVVGVHPQITSGEVRLGLPAEYQKVNASLAVAIAAEHLGCLGAPVETEVLPERFRKGLEEVVWPGRCQVKVEGNVEWCIDGAHTVESLSVAGEWFSGRVDKNATTTRVLIFNQQTRDSTALICSLATSLAAVSPFDHAIFCTNVTWKDAGYKADLVSMNTNPTQVSELQVQKTLEAAWKEQTAAWRKQAETHVVATIEGAVGVVGELSAKGEVQVFVTGSLHLVGGLLEVLDG